MANPGNGLWQASLIPQTSVLQTIGVTYGPGNPSDRWFTNIGGQIAFVPLQPTDAAGGELALIYGSFQTENVTASYQFGKHDGWSTVLAFGADHANSYQEAADGFGTQSHNYAVYLKTRGERLVLDERFLDECFRRCGYRGSRNDLSRSPTLTDSVLGER